MEDVIELEMDVAADEVTVFDVMLEELEEIVEALGRVVVVREMEDDETVVLLGVFTRVTPA